MTDTGPDHEWELLRAIDPLLDEHKAPFPGPGDREDLFAKIIANDHAPRRRTARTAHRRRPWEAVGLSGTAAARVRLGVVASLVAAVIAFVVVNLLPATHTPGGVGSAWAKRVIARATAVLTTSGNGILHIQETDTVSGGASFGIRDGSYQVESWQQQTPPYDYWQTTQSESGSIPTATATTVIGNEEQQYDASTNTLLEIPNVPNTSGGAGASINPAYRTAQALLDSQDAGTEPGTSTGTEDQPSGDLSDLLAQLLSAPGVTVDSGANLDGASAISITGYDGRDRFYVQPGTYEPLEFVGTQEMISRSVARPVNGISAVTTKTTSWTTTIKFDTYQTLPAGSVAPPNLQQLHPTAATIQSPPDHSTTTSGTTTTPTTAAITQPSGTTTTTTTP